MLSTTLITLTAIAGLTAAAPAPQATALPPDVVFDIYPNLDCPGADPVAVPNPNDFDGYCHSLEGAWKSANIALTFEGATQKLQLFEDEACTVESLTLYNEGNVTGQCFSDPLEAGWKGFIYETYR